MNPQKRPPMTDQSALRIENERASQGLVRAFVLSGTFFMLLPGTFLGVWNLISISEAHEVGSLPQGWLQAHGQAQIFGWVGSFILGIGFYSLTKMQTGRAFPRTLGWAVWILWSGSIGIRWFAGVTEWKWRFLLPLSAVLELVAFLLFYASVRRHRPQSHSKPETWMRIVVASTVVFLIALAANCALLFWQALRGSSPALPHALDQEFVTVSVWGILVPTIWGFNARWLPVFAGLKKPAGNLLLSAYLLSIAGLATTFLGWLLVAVVLLLCSAILSIMALNVWKPAVNPAKILNVHRSLPSFIRIAYGWLLISCVLALLAVWLDRSGGLWGASRHAVTVGFVAGMVFAIGQRVLPAFCGMRVLWSTRLMFWSLALLSAGCLLRVASEPVAYQHLWTPAWSILPVSALLELAAVSLFALNIIATLLQAPAHLQPQRTHV